MFDTGRIGTGRSSQRLTHQRRFVCWGPRNAGMKPFVNTAGRVGKRPSTDEPCADSHRQLEYACLTLGGTRVSLSAVPDHVRESALARAALRDADRVLVFVPARVDRIEDTVRSLELLEQTLKEVGRDLAQTALAWVWVLPSWEPCEPIQVEDLESMFNPLGQPSVVLDPEDGYAEAVHLACLGLARDALIAG